MNRPQIWAHRGASFHAPENSLEAFALAREMGADGIELDIHLSKDGKLVVVHDETVDRCSSSTGRIADMTLREIKELDFSNRKPGYRGVRAPTLGEVYELLKDSQMTINVELKFGAALNIGMEEKCIQLAREMGMQDQVCYSSFNHYSLQRLRALDASAKVAPLYIAVLFNPWNYAKSMNAHAVHPYYRTLAIPGVMEGLKSAGLRCNPWTVDDAESMKWLAKLGVDAIITNRPDVALLAFAEMTG